MSRSSDTAVVLLCLVSIVVAFFGWVMNIVQLVSADSIGGLEVARAIGVFMAPLGAVLGFIGG